MPLHDNGPLQVYQIPRSRNDRICRNNAGISKVAHDSVSPPSPITAGLAGRCPRCGKGKLFTGFLTLSPACETCGLDFSFADAGDGPAVFVILLAGFVVVGLALIVEFLYQPPFWLHALLWGPLILLVTLGPLRPLKGVLIALQYHHDAAEGRLERRDRP
jgi:uncharacterized protein (DUF983 family)